MNRSKVVARFTALTFAIAAPFAFATAAQAEKAGQLCAKAKEGSSAKDAGGASLTCKADGTRFRWVSAGGAAPAPTKAAPKTVTTKPAAGTKTTKASGASAGGGTAVKGRFCAKADDGRRDTNAKGEKLICKADAKGKNRWQLA